MRKLIFVLSMATILVSCSKDDDFGGGALETVAFSVDVTYDDENFNGEPAEAVEVTLTNTNTGDEYTGLTTETGVVNFEEILPGTYNLSGSVSLNDVEFEALFGYAPTESSVVFNASLEQVEVNTTSTSASLMLKTARIGNLVIKQIYYAGSDTQDGAMFRDQFIEIYNNSNAVIYADSLYIAQLYGNTSTNVESYTLATGQFDWSQSIGMSGGEAANTDYVYAEYIIQIPGNGQEYPIQPGESIVIAQNGINHKEPLVDNNGDPIAIGNPALTVDLSGANFEAYLGDFKESIGEEPYQWDIQNPAVTDVSIAYWGREGYPNRNRDLLLDPSGRDSFVIFRSEGVLQYSNYPDPSEAAIVEGTNFYMQIPNELVIDGVELQNYNPARSRPKMLPAAIDASAIAIDGMYNSQSVIRKTKTTVNGRVILEDSNNTAEDFIKLDKAAPGGFAE